VAAVAYLACALVWGTTWYAIRVCIGPDGYPTYLSAALRFTLAALVMAGLLLAGFGRPLPSRRKAGWVVVAGLLNSVGYALVYRAEQDISGGLAAVLYGTMPLITALLAAATRTERLRPSTVAGALTGVAGITVIFWERLTVSAGQAVAVVLVLLSVTLASTYSVLLKRQAADLNPLASIAVFFPSTGLGLWLLTLAVERQLPPWPPPAAPSIALVYLALFGSVVTFGAYFYLVGHVRLATLTTLVFLEPVFALIVDALFEHRVRLEPLTYVGSGITVGGVLVMVFLGRPGLREPKTAPSRDSTQLAAQ
jgi:drug/metabolite transporter (DMT)-like permease